MSLVFTPEGTPASPQEGEVYYDSTADKLKVRDSSAFREVVTQDATFNGTIGTSASGSANLPAVKTALNASGSAPIYACRAWVNFNPDFTDATGQSGTYACSGSTITITDTSHGLSVGDSIRAVFTRSSGDSTSITDDLFNVLTVPSADTFTIQTVVATTDQSGTVAYDSNALTATAEGPIRGSGNVSSITDVSTGRFIVNFSTAMPDTNYAMAGTAGNDGTTSSGRSINRDGVWTTSQAHIRCAYGSTAADDDYIGVSFFR